MPSGLSVGSLGGVAGLAQAIAEGDAERCRALSLSILSSELQLPQSLRAEAYALLLSDGGAPFDAAAADLSLLDAAPSGLGAVLQRASEADLGAAARDMGAVQRDAAELSADLGGGEGTEAALAAIALSVCRPNAQAWPGGIPYDYPAMAVPAVLLRAGCSPRDAALHLLRMRRGGLGSTGLLLSAELPDAARRCSVGAVRGILADLLRRLVAYHAPSLALKMDAMASGWEGPSPLRPPSEAPEQRRLREETSETLDALESRWGDAPPPEPPRGDGLPAREAAQRRRHRPEVVGAPHGLLGALFAGCAPCEALLPVFDRAIAARDAVFPLFLLAACVLEAAPALEGDDAPRRMWADLRSGALFLRRGEGDMAAGVRALVARALSLDAATPRSFRANHVALWGAEVRHQTLLAEHIAAEERALAEEPKRSISVLKRSLSRALRPPRRPQRPLAARLPRPSCLAVSAEEVLPSVLGEGPPWAGDGRLPPECRGGGALDFLVVDLRPPELLSSCGFGAAHHLDAALLRDPEALEAFAEALRARAGRRHVAVASTGLRTFLAQALLEGRRLVPERRSALERAAADRADANTLCLFLLKRGFERVSLVDGGFAALHHALLKRGGGAARALVAHEGVYSAALRAEGAARGAREGPAAPRAAPGSFLSSLSRRMAALSTAPGGGGGGAAAEGGAEGGAEGAGDAGESVFVIGGLEDEEDEAPEARGAAEVGESGAARRRREQRAEERKRVALAMHELTGLTKGCVLRLTRAALPGAMLFRAEKDKQRLEGSRLVTEAVTRWICVTTERLLVLDAGEKDVALGGGAADAATAVVKSNRHLTELGRMTFPRKDAHRITFYFKGKGAPDAAAAKKQHYRVQLRDELVTALQNTMRHFQ